MSIINFLEMYVASQALQVVLSTIVVTSILLGIILTVSVIVRLFVFQLTINKKDFSNFFLNTLFMYIVFNFIGYFYAFLTVEHQNSKAFSFYIFYIVGLVFLGFLADSYCHKKFGCKRKFDFFE